MAILLLVLAVGGCAGRELVTTRPASGEEEEQGEAGEEGEEQSEQANIKSTPELEAAVKDYRGYLLEQSDQLVGATREFTDAVIAGDVGKAKELYVPARVYWERVEPVTETFGGNIDPRLDARINDVPQGEKWYGFHGIEQALWVKNTTEGQGWRARQLLDDTERLRQIVGEAKIEPSDLVTGSVELLNEISGSKIKGEEERYSRIDLYDMSANVAGSKAAYNALRPALDKKDPALARDIDQRFKDVEAVFGSFEKNGRYVSYSELDQQDTSRISQAVDALAESVSQVGKVL